MIDANRDLGVVILEVTTVIWTALMDRGFTFKDVDGMGDPSRNRVPTLWVGIAALFKHLSNAWRFVRCVQESNVGRVFNWFEGLPRVKTHVPMFAQLVLQV